MLTAPRAILFDWDETLVNSWETILNSVNHTRRHYGLEIWSVEESHQKINRSMRDSFPEMFGDQWEEAAKIFRNNILETHLDYLTAKPGAEELLDYLQRNNILMGLISNKVGGILRKEIAHLEWQKYFPEPLICGAEDGPYDKPHPECWSGMRPLFQQWKGKDIWFVGDKRIDMEFAHNIGSIGVFLSPTAPLEDWRGTRLDLHLKDCLELLDFIKNSKRICEQKVTNL